jgi:helix-turn-helix protein/uncharacterized protein DUF4115
VFEIGSSLRTAREHRQLQLSDVERATNIRSKYLAALEDEQFDVLPGTAYVKGFLRTYANFLGLDGATFVEEFNERYAPEELPEAAAPVRIQAPRRLVSARVLVVPLVLLAVGVVAWRLAAGSGGSSGPTRTAFAPTAPRVPVTTAAASQPKVATTPKRAQIAFVASRGSCWLSVRLGSATGRVLYEQTLQPGRRAQFAGTHLWIRIGAPWNLDATVDGKRVQLPTATADVMLTAGGLRSL